MKKKYCSDFFTQKKAYLVSLKSYIDIMGLNRLHQANLLLR